MIRMEEERQGTIHSSFVRGVICHSTKRVNTNITVQLETFVSLIVFLRSANHTWMWLLETCLLSADTDKF